MYMVDGSAAKGSQTGRNPLPLFFGVDIEECSKCGGFGTPDEFESGVCSNCTLLECFEALGPLEGFDDLGLVRGSECLPAMLRQAGCLRGTVIA